MKNLIIASMLVFSIIGCHEEEAEDCAEAVVAEEEAAEETSEEESEEIGDDTEKPEMMPEESKEPEVPRGGLMGGVA